MGAELPEPGTVRPGGRTARTRAVVLLAVGDALVERGFGNFDLAEVARRAGVGKTTVYRRWGTVPALVADLLSEMADASPPRTETGSLLGDLTAIAETLRTALSDRRQGPLLKAIVAAGASDAQSAAALHRFYRARVADLAPCVEQAVERGEAPEGTDAGEVIRAVAAPLYFRFMVSGHPLDRAAAERAAASAAAAAEAGVFAEHPRGSAQEKLGCSASPAPARRAARPTGDPTRRRAASLER